MAVAAPPRARASPYQGLRPYGEDDARYFFGRDVDTRLIVANLFAAPLTLLYGPTGVGKTSVLEAGVMPKLRSRDHVVAVTFRAWQASDDYVADLEAAIARAVPEPVEHEDAEPLTRYLERCVEQLERRVMVVLDQFEEYFLRPGDSVFERELAAAVNRRGLPVSFLLSLREDALAALDRFQGSVPSLFQNYLRIDHLARAGAAEAIVRPVEVFDEEFGTSTTIGDGFVDAVLDELEPEQLGLDRPWQPPSERRRGRIETPYLQLVLERLWNEEQELGSTALRASTLQSIGGAKRIVRTYLDDGLAALSPHEQELAARMFRHLVTPSGTKIALTVSDLAEYASAEPEQLGPVLERLARAEWILRRIAPPFAQDKPRYEIVHDYLAPAVLRWRARYLAERERLRRRRRIVVASVVAAVAAAAGFSVLGIELAHQTKKAESAQENLHNGVLQLGDRGKSVKNAQYLLGGNNAFGEQYYSNVLDGIFGRPTAEAVREAKFWLGYPSNAVNSTYDAKLSGFLAGLNDLPKKYEARRAARLSRARSHSVTARTTVGASTTSTVRAVTTTLPATVVETTAPSTITTAPAIP